MSEEEFLARWSRRKREAKAKVVSADEVVPDDVQSAPSQPAAEEGEEEIDLSSLPPIDSITSATDITAFLRKGIPQELTRAALRRAWSADPAIRDFVGLAENAWDFNDPNAMPGFGPLDCSEGELAELLDRVIGGVRKVAEGLPDASAEPADHAESGQELRQAEAFATAEAIVDSAAPEFSSRPAAAHPRAADGTGDESDPVRRRRHGGALPQ